MQSFRVIEGPGTLGIGTCKDVERQILAGLLAGGPGVVLNLSRTQSIDGAGIGVLLWAQALARRTGSMLRMVAPTAAVRAFLQHMDLLRDFHFHESLDEVLLAS